MKPLQDIYVNRENAILTIVDMQNKGCVPGGGSYNEFKARIIPPAVAAIKKLADQARSVGIPVIYIQSVRTTHEPEVTVFGLKPYRKIGTWEVEIIDELKPQPKDVVIQKFCHDPFYKTDLGKILEKLVPDPTKHFAILVGGAINSCLYFGVMGFYLRNYWTAVVTDGVYYPDEAAKERALGQFSQKSYPNIFLTRSDLVHISADSTVTGSLPIPGD